MDTQNNLNQITEPEITTKQRHFLAAFFLSFMWGTFGIDRFYLGKYWTGLLKLLTLGGFGLWTLIDLALIMSGSMRDKKGNEMLDFTTYSKFARKTVSIFSITVLLVFALSGISAYYAISQFLQNGGLDRLIPNIDGQTIDVNQLRNLNINL